MWKSRAYTIKEKVDIGRGKALSQAALWDTFLSTDLTTKVQGLDIPVYFFHGRHDYTVSYDLAKKYCDQLEAPLKGFYTFGRSAHSPAFEEPELTRRILLEDVLAGQNRLADTA
jgi:pimeloyl-ACP methyl ester carboxylesterase